MSPFLRQDIAEAGPLLPPFLPSFSFSFTVTVRRAKRPFHMSIPCTGGSRTGAKTLSFSPLSFFSTFLFGAGAASFSMFLGDILR